MLGLYFPIISWSDSDVHTPGQGQRQQREGQDLRAASPTTGLATCCGWPTSCGGRCHVQRRSQGSWLAAGEDQVVISWFSLQRCASFFRSTREVKQFWCRDYIFSSLLSAILMVCVFCYAPGPNVLRVDCNIYLLLSETFLGSFLFSHILKKFWCLECNSVPLGQF